MTLKQIMIQLRILRGEVKRLARAREKAQAAEWEYYREIYRKLSFKEKKLLHEFWYRRFPVQRGYAGDLRFFVRNMGRVNRRIKRRKIRVAEYGGRDGGLANALMSKYPRLDWVNYEIIGHKPHPGLGKRSYREHVLGNELWLEKPDLSKVDVFVSCNTLEHVNGNQIYALFNYLRKQEVPRLLMRVCAPPRGENWRGYVGSHVLRMGTDEIKGILRKRGYSLVVEENYEKDLAFLKGWCSYWVLEK